jgi:DNA-binding MarR family transcriptional regulator
MLESDAEAMNDESDKDAVAEQVWRSMFGFLMHTRPQRDAVVSRLGLTPTECKALYSLDGQRSRTMKQLATAWQCDASTATWTVDRLERLDMAERRPDPHDRRLRLVLLTAKGVATRAELLQGMFATPPELLDLTQGQLLALRDLLANLPTGLDEPPSAS